MPAANIAEDLMKGTLKSSGTAMGDAMIAGFNNAPANVISDFAEGVASNSGAGSSRTRRQLAASRKARNRAARDAQYAPGQFGADPDGQMELFDVHTLADPTQVSNMDVRSQNDLYDVMDGQMDFFQEVDAATPEVRADIRRRKLDAYEDGAKRRAEMLNDTGTANPEADEMFRKKVVDDIMNRKLKGPQGEGIDPSDYERLAEANATKSINRMRAEGKYIPQRDEYFNTQKAEAAAVAVKSGDIKRVGMSKTGKAVMAGSGIGLAGMVGGGFIVANMNSGVDMEPAGPPRYHQGY